MFTLKLLEQKLASSVDPEQITSSLIQHCVKTTSSGRKWMVIITIYIYKELLLLLLYSNTSPILTVLRKSMEERDYLRTIPSIQEKW